MDEFISEPLEPLPGSFASVAMATGLPGLPQGFTWRQKTYRVLNELEQWKQSAPEGGRPGAERYLRRHCYRLRMDDGTIWTVYFERQARRGANPRLRWFLYSMASEP